MINTQLRKSSKYIRQSQMSSDTYKVVFFSVKPRNVSAGDAVVDCRLIQLLRQHLDLTCVTLPPSKTAHIVGSWVRNLTPHTYSRYNTKSNSKVVADTVAETKPVRVIFSHECLAPLAKFCKQTPYTILIHNVHSCIDTFGMLEYLLQYLYIRYERRLLSNIKEAIFLSIRDMKCAESLIGSRGWRCIPPGMPPDGFPLQENPVVEESLIIAGSIDWYRKGRDFTDFMRQFNGKSIPLIALNDMSRYLGQQSYLDAGEVDFTSTIRFGLSFDRFRAGFKLKVLDFINRNAIVLSLADLSDEFIGLPYAHDFVRHVRSVDEAEEIMKHVAAQPPGRLARHLNIFKASCEARFDWYTLAAGVAPVTASVL